MSLSIARSGQAELPWHRLRLRLSLWLKGFSANFCKMDHLGSFKRAPKIGEGDNGARDSSAPSYVDEFTLAANSPLPEPMA